jgi:hypothetical protein
VTVKHGRRCHTRGTAFTDGRRLAAAVERIHEVETELGRLREQQAAPCAGERGRLLRTPAKHAPRVRCRRPNAAILLSPFGPA